MLISCWILIPFSSPSCSNNQETRAHFKSDKDNKESLPHTQQTEDVMPNTEMDSCPSSSFQRNKVHSQTKDTTSMSSAQASEYEEAESGISFCAWPHSVNYLKCITFLSK